jgi:fumarate hydratase class II
MNAISLLTKQDIRKETDSLGEVDVPSDMLWDRRLSGHWSISASVRI